MISSVVSSSATVSRSGGKTRLVGDLAADRTVAAYEGQVIGIGAGGVSGVFHDVTYRVVGQQQRPDLLSDQFRSSGSEHPVVACLVCFDLIALWLGHENVNTTQIYLQADLALKQQALDKTTPPSSPPGRYQPPDHLLAFLESL